MSEPLQAHCFTPGYHILQCTYKTSLLCAPKWSLIENTDACNWEMTEVTLEEKHFDGTLGSPSRR